MRIIAAYLLAVLGGNSSPSAEDIKAILDSVGISTDTDRADKLVAELHGKDISEIIAAGKSKLSAVPSVAAPAASAAAPAAAAAAPAAGGKAKDEGKKKKDEEEEEADADMGGLFGGDEEEGY